MRYRVEVHRTDVLIYEVEASDGEEAIILVMDNDPEPDELREGEPDVWSVEAVSL